MQVLLFTYLQFGVGHVYRPVARPTTVPPPLFKYLQGFRNLRWGASGGSPPRRGVVRSPLATSFGCRSQWPTGHNVATWFLLALQLVELATSSGGRDRGGDEEDVLGAPAAVALGVWESWRPGEPGCVAQTAHGMRCRSSSE